MRCAESFLPALEESGRLGQRRFAGIHLTTEFERPDETA